jgi:hypothetical protein
MKQCRRKINTKLKIMFVIMFQVICLKTNCIYAHAKENEYDFLTKGGHMFDPINEYLNRFLYQITKLGILIFVICFLIIIIKKHFRRY